MRQPDASETTQRTLQSRVESAPCPVWLPTSRRIDVRASRVQLASLPLEVFALLAWATRVGATFAPAGRMGVAVGQAPGCVGLVLPAGVRATLAVLWPAVRVSLDAGVVLAERGGWPAWETLGGRARACALTRATWAGVAHAVLSPAEVWRWWQAVARHRALAATRASAGGRPLAPVLARILAADDVPAVRGTAPTFATRLAAGMPLAGER